MGTFGLSRHHSICRLAVPQSDHGAIQLWSLMLHWGQARNGWGLEPLRSFNRKSLEQDERKPSTSIQVRWIQYEFTTLPRIALQVTKNKSGGSLLLHGQEWMRWSGQNDSLPTFFPPCVFVFICAPWLALPQTNINKLHTCTWYWTSEAQRSDYGNPSFGLPRQEQILDELIQVVVSINTFWCYPRSSWWWTIMLRLRKIAKGSRLVEVFFLLGVVKARSSLGYSGSLAGT